MKKAMFKKALLLAAAAATTYVGVKSFMYARLLWKLRGGAVGDTEWSQGDAIPGLHDVEPEGDEICRFRVTSQDDEPKSEGDSATE